MRITQVVTTDLFAGTERYVVEVGAALAARGHDVRVLGGDPATMRRLVDPPLQWVPAATTKAAVGALVRGGRRDVVHSHITRSDFAAAAAAPATRARRVSTRHITAPRGWTAAARLAAVPVRRTLACEVAVSDWVSQELDRPADAVLLNGVRPVDDDGQQQQDVVLVAQRLAGEKDTATALRAFAASGLAGRGWRLVVAGTGEERDDLQALAVELGIDSATGFPGWVADMDAAYRSAAVLLAPSPREPCGLTVLEAMAHGLAVVAAGSAGHLETVGQDPRAALFPPGDSAAAAAHLVRLADDREARRAYGRDLQRLQREHLSLDEHVDRLEALYAGLLRRA